MTPLREATLRALFTLEVIDKTVREQPFPQSSVGPIVM